MVLAQGGTSATTTISFVSFCSWVFVFLAGFRMLAVATATGAAAVETFDLVVIGGGSAGLAAAKEAARLKKSVCVLDYVTPSPTRGTTWGIGGTCVNVGCIPKKLFHEAALLRTAVSEAQAYGWQLAKSAFDDKVEISNNWVKLVETVGDYLASTRWKIRRDLKMLNVTYKNAFGSFADNRTVIAREPAAKKGTEETAKKPQEFVETQLVGKFILVAVGMRPKLFSNPELNKYVITSDDFFSLKTPPGKTLIIGAGYVAMEFAGILVELGFNTTVAVRSQLLRRFDTDMVQLIRSDLKQRGVRFCNSCEVRNITLLKEEKTGDGHLARTLTVDFINVLTKRKHTDVFNTVICAIGRAPAVEKLHLDSAKIKYNTKTGKIVTKMERTSVYHIFAAGDVIEGPPELTPIAIKAGEMIARRMFDKSREKMEYGHVPTTVFTPLEYGFVGLTEQEAIIIFDEKQIDVYHSYFYPLEWEISRPSGSGDNSKCFLKVICLRKSGRILGLHYTGPRAGDIIQGFSIAIQKVINIRELQKSIGIHPTIAEHYTRLKVTKRSGESPRQLSCCS